MSKKQQKQYYIKIIDREQRKRLAEEYGMLGYILLPRGQYVLVVPSKEKKQKKAEEKANHKKKEREKGS